MGPILGSNLFIDTYVRVTVTHVLFIYIYICFPRAPHSSK